MENGAGGEEEYTRDGSVDLRGNPVLRSRRGGWRACSFIVGTVRAVREDGVLRDSVEPGDIPDGEAAPGHRGGGQQRHQLVRDRLHHAAHRRRRRRRLPRPLLDLRRRLRRLPHGHAAADSGGVGASTEAAGVRRRRRRSRLPARLRAPAWRLLRRAVHHRARPRRHETEHLHHRRRPVRRLPPAGEAAEALLLQLVDVHHIPRHPLLHHRPRLPPGQRQLDGRLRHPHARADDLRRRLPRRHAAVPPQGASGQPARDDGEGDCRGRVEVPRPGSRRLEGAARAGAGALHEQARVPDGHDELHGVPEQGGGEVCRRRVRGAAARVDPVHGDAGGGDEADREAGAAARHHGRAVHAGGAGGHAVRQAGSDAGPPHRQVPRAAGEPGRVRDGVHARLHRALRPVPRPRRPPAHQEPERDHAAAADQPGHAAPNRNNGGHVGGREPTAELCAEARPRRHRRAAAADDLHPPAAVRADGRRRRVPGGGPDRVLLRPGAGEHEEPRHGDVADGVWRREPAEQRHPHPGGARHRREGGAVGDEQPQRLAARLLLRVPRHPRRGEPAGVRRAQLQVLVPRRVDGDDRRRHGRSAGTKRVSSEAAPMAA